MKSERISEGARLPQKIEFRSHKNKWKPLGAQSDRTLTTSGAYSCVLICVTMMQKSINKREFLVAKALSLGHKNYVCICLIWRKQDVGSTNN